jgi:hypothetical protein
MRRVIAMVAAALVTPALVTAASAAAQAADGGTAQVPAATGPAGAIQREIADKAGVTVTTELRTSLAGKELARLQQTGTVRLGGSGMVAADVTASVTGAGGKFGDYTLRTVVYDKAVYQQSSAYARFLPKGKSWVRVPGEEGGIVTGLINVLDPATLKTMVAKAGSKRPGGTVGGERTTLYQGSTTLPALSRLGGPLTSLTKSLSIKSPDLVPWKLWVGADQLPRRLQATIDLSGVPLLGDKVLTLDTTLTGWGEQAKISAPPADQVVSVTRLASNVPLLGYIPFVKR